MIVTVLCGGRSTEHEISLRSAASVVENLLAMQLSVQVIEIKKDGKWFWQQSIEDWLKQQSSSRQSVSIDFSGSEPGWQVGDNFYAAGIVFPVLHGKFGEDGAIQGLLETMNVPYISTSILGAATTANKAVCKQLLQQAGIQVVDYKYFQNYNTPTYDECAEQLGSTLFVKSVSGGSSIGVEKVINAQEYQVAVDKIFKIDAGILVERAITGRELECAVMKSDKYIISVLGQISFESGFYDYTAKYRSVDKAKLLVPAPIASDAQKMVQATAEQACKVLHIDGFARVDFFLDGEQLYLNEVNTIPGFTDISLFPRMFAQSGWDYPKLLKQLLDAALIRHSQANKLIENVYGQ